jgi:hypothetical protein
MSDKQRRLFDEKFHRQITDYMKCDKKKKDDKEIREGNMTAEGRIPVQKYLEAEATLAAQKYRAQNKEDIILLEKTIKLNKASTGKCHTVGCASKSANHLVLFISLYILFLFYIAALLLVLCVSIYILKVYYIGALL